MKLNELVKKTNKFFNVDITTSSRRMNVNIARKIYFNTARSIGYPLSFIGSSVNRSHSMVFVAVKRHDECMLYDTLYKNNYNDFQNYLYGARIEIKLNKTILKGFNELLLLNDAELLEFKETRLKPFLRMLDSRKQQKVIENVAGAKILR